MSQKGNYIETIKNLRFRRPDWEVEQEKEEHKQLQAKHNKLLKRSLKKK